MLQIGAVELILLALDRSIFVVELQDEVGKGRSQAAAVNKGGVLLISLSQALFEGVVPLFELGAVFGEGIGDGLLPVSAISYPVMGLTDRTGAFAVLAEMLVP